jgi:hypothetical protein
MSALTDFQAFKTTVSSANPTALRKGARMLCHWLRFEENLTLDQTRELLKEAATTLEGMPSHVSLVPPPPY